MPLSLILGTFCLLDPRFANVLEVDVLLQCYPCGGRSLILEVICLRFPSDILSAATETSCLDHERMNHNRAKEEENR